MPRARRIRQHVNPLAERYSLPRAHRVVRPAYLGPHAPIEVELGCADAQFSFALARARPDALVVGLDIRDRIVQLGARRAAAEGLRNLVLTYCNLGVDLDRVFAAGEVDRFHLLFPDPWFKQKHHKRRVLEPAVLSVVHAQLRRGGELHVASDVFEIAMAAMAEVDGDPDSGFENLSGPWRFHRENPYGVRSRREDTTLARGQRVWRVIWRRIERDAQPPDISTSMVGR